MHQAIAAVLGAGLFLCAGCFTAPPPPLMAPPAPKAVEPPPVPPVRPDEVKAENYRTIPQRISDELDRAEQENMSAQKGE